MLVILWISFKEVVLKGEGVYMNSLDTLSDEWVNRIHISLLLEFSVLITVFSFILTSPLEDISSMLIKSSS